mmetsp:Transcript_2863/g.4694  ORF Transcript_2863/g.4694 Transcript_2863/m.4694 type:complete len:338 (+) Transcript_2863:1-1014(+)
MVKPIILKGHDRPVSQVLFNREGDLLFTASKGKSMNCAVWFSESGERIGTFDGHAGAVFSMDITFDSRFLLTGSGDSSTRIWNARTGEELAKFVHNTPVAWVKWALGDKRFLSVTKGVMGKKPEIQLYKVDDPFNIASTEPYMKITGASSITYAYWGPLNENIYASHGDGSLSVYDAETGKLKQTEKPHTKEITGMKFSKDQQYFATSSKDNTVKMFDTNSLECFKTFVAGKPFTDVCISPNRPHLFAVGSQDVGTVTTHAADSAQFRARVLHCVFEKEIGSIQGHFAPVNSITCSPDGTLMVTGGEDGYARINKLDQSYFKDLSDEVLFPMDAPEI